MTDLTDGRPPRSPVAVTGLGATTPLGGDVRSTWTAALAGESGVHLLEEDWAAEQPVRIAAALRVDPGTILDRVLARRLDRVQQVALVAAREAWLDAGPPGVEPERLAVVVGTGVGGSRTLAEQHRVLLERGPKRMSPFAVPMYMPNGSAAAVSLDLEARAGAHAPMSACASGAEAIALGLALLQTGRADVVVAGGAEACLGGLSMGCFARMGALSRRHDDPQGASRPFDVSRDGFVMGEGAGMLVLERYDFASARGARVHAVLAGAGVSADAYDITTPSIEGQVRALREALHTGDLSPSDVTHVNAHATGTPAGDTIEAQAVGKAIGLHPKLTAPKSLTGHMIGGSGAVEAVLTVLSLKEQIVPPTRNLTDQDPEVELDVVRDRAQALPMPAAISNSFGFGGHNAVLAFTRAA